MNKAILTRLEDNGKQTIGFLKVYKDGIVIETMFTLELPWKNNEVGKSCIDTGMYKVEKYSSPKYPKAYKILNVIGRSHILIHPANYYTQLRGCVALGKGVIDINKDNIKDVTNSGDALKRLIKIFNHEGFSLVVRRL